jgi:hypothetical protein
MTDSPIPQLCDAVSGASMMDNLRELARWVKLSGSREEMESLRFVEARMAEYGFRTRILLHDAYISLPGVCSVTANGERLSAITQSFSRSSPAGGLHGEMVYLPNDAQAEAGLDLRGRILLLDGMATPAAAVRAKRLGAAGHLHISHHEHLHEMCISPVWGSPSRDTERDLPTAVVATVSLADGTALRERLTRGEKLEVTIEAEVDTGWRKTPILVAEMEAPDQPADAPLLLLSGHHDTWYYGVMDNGGANVGMMEIARLCAQRRDAWQRGLRVCFWSGHSHGRYSGSAWYADAHWDELDRRCVAHVNVDSLGGVGTTTLHATAAMSSLRHLAAEAVELHAGEAYVGKRKGRSGDDSLVGIGIPSMFGPVSEQTKSAAAARNALGWWWHTPEDLLDKVDEANLVRDTKVVLHATARLLTDPVLPLDIAATLRDLHLQVASIAPAVADMIDLAGVIASVELLVQKAEAVHLLPAPAANAALMKAARALVPADYTAGDRFSHPPALPVPAWPTLQPLRILAEADAGTEARHFMAVEARRARNRIVHALRETEAALDAAWPTSPSEASA